jgi:WD40 repeat protein
VSKVIGEYWPIGPLLVSGDGTKLVYHSISSKERKAFFIVCQVVQNEVQCEKNLESVPVYDNYALSPDGNILAFVNLWSRSVEFWDLQSKMKVNTINVGNDPLGISFSPDGNRILIASNDGFHVWGLKP